MATPFTVVRIQPHNFVVAVVKESQIDDYADKCRAQRRVKRCAECMADIAEFQEKSHASMDNGGAVTMEGHVGLLHTIVVVLPDEYSEENVIHEALHVVIDTWTYAGKKLSFGGEFDDSELLTYGQAQLVNEIRTKAYKLGKMK